MKRKRELDVEGLKLSLREAQWQPSKRGGPHEYILDTNYPLLFSKVEALVKAEGKRETVNGYTQRYWKFDGYRYWIMPGIRFLPKCFVLNRVKV